MAKTDDDDTELLWISYGRGFRRCLETILTMPELRVLIACSGSDAPEIAPRIRQFMREAMIKATPAGSAQGFDSFDDAR